MNYINSGEKLHNYWQVDGIPPSFDNEEIRKAIFTINKPVCIIKKDGRFALGEGGAIVFDTNKNQSGCYSIAGYVPSYALMDLGDITFCKDFGLNYPYLVGAMANGITSVEMLREIGKAGMMGFFGAGGLSLDEIEQAILQLSTDDGENIPFGFNLIHNINNPSHETGVVDLYLKHKIRVVEAAAYVELTKPIVKFRVHGIHQDAQGRIVVPNSIIAKVSRVEVASRFFSPPPEKILQKLVSEGTLSESQAELAKKIPMAQDITAEADSGGHTDNRSAITLLPIMLALRDQMQKKFNYTQKLRVGSAGGVATPASVAAVFSMGAAYVLTGSINQSCVEAGTSDTVREMLSKVSQTDVAMAPSADMMEIGSKVQVVKYQTMFAMRATKLYKLYRAYDSLEEIPEKEKIFLEKNIFRHSLEDIWDETVSYFQRHDPEQIERAKNSKKHKMALVFRWYLGQTSLWANKGESSRKIDYQIWCGPAMGAFNEWVKGSFLEEVSNRRVVTVALNLLYCSVVSMRINSLRCQGVLGPLQNLHITPQRLEHIH